ncbi:MAG: hypothetical protein ACPLZY_04410 [Candidatus Norongarragalinales archaeon]
MTNKKRGALALIALMLLAFLVVAKGGFLPLTEIGYIAGSQGLQAEFHSLWFNNSYCSATEKPAWATKASSWSFGYEMDFDPDVGDDGWCDIAATQQLMTLDTDVEPKHYSWTVDQGTVTLPNGTQAKKSYQFEMWRYRLTWKINIWLSGTEAEALDETLHFITWEPNYGGSVLWIRLVPKNFAYFKDNPDMVYFAPAYIALNSLTWAAVDQNGQTIQNDPQMMTTQDLIPKATGEASGIYYTRGGTPINLETELLKYQGMALDTAIFRNEYWTRIIFQNFKPLNGFSYNIWHWWKYPSAFMEFTVYVYVVGRWTVYFATGEVPSLTPHYPIFVSGNPIDAFFSALASALTNPLTQFWLILIVIVIVLIFAGPTIVALIAAFRKKG